MAFRKRFSRNRRSFRGRPARRSFSRRSRTGRKRKFSRMYQVARGGIRM